MVATWGVWGDGFVFTYMLFVERSARLVVKRILKLV